MNKAILGKKVGMTQLFDEAGKVIPVTVVEAGPCVVVQKKTAENDGYCALQIDVYKRQDQAAVPDGGLHLGREHHPGGGVQHLARPGGGGHCL